MSQSYTGNINTNGEWKSVATLTGLTMTEGKTFNMQISSPAFLKVGNAVFSFNNEKFDYKASSDDLKIQTISDCKVSILETA